MIDDDLDDMQLAWIRATYRAMWIKGYQQAQIDVRLKREVLLEDLEARSAEAATDAMLAREEMGLNG